jgi:transposase InsO family protein
VEQHVRHCRECQSNTDRQSFEPLKPSKMPDKPWQSVSADFFGPTPGGWYWFVNICDHSNKAFVSKIWAPSEDSVEPVLDHLFSTFGAPETYKTDNGSPFQSHRFMDFAKKWGFKHRRVTPEWPRANGKAESFMKKLGKVLKTAKIGGTNEQEALMEFLRRYNETPHSTTGVAPNHLFLGFSRSSGIPSMLPETPEQREKWRKLALENDARAKKRMETEYNRRMRAKEPTISVGSQVLVKLKKQRKDTSAWDREPYTVTAVNGSMVTASRRDHTVTRNSSCFKLYRHVGFDLPDEEAAKSAPTPVQPNPEGREELAQASQRASQETVPSQETADQASQDLPVVHSNKSAQPKHLRTQRRRPTLEESAKIQQARAEAQAAKRALNPPTRQSIRTQVKR